MARTGSCTVEKALGRLEKALGRLEKAPHSLDKSRRVRIRRLAAGAASEPAPAPPAWNFERELGPAPLARDAPLVTDLLYGRLSPDHVAEIERRMPEMPALAELYAQTRDEAVRRSLVLHFGAWQEVPVLAQRTGLPGNAEPPEGVHAMGRGPTAAAGGLYEADMVLSALLSAQADPRQIGEALDFGCSSGRVVRVLGAAFPEVRWRGCDPNRLAIEWAREKVPGVGFFLSTEHPPLPIDDCALGLVYAISIWSHFAPGLGLRWFEEMRRVIRPGGHLVFTTHGWQSIAAYVGDGSRSPEEAHAIAEGLYRRGAWYSAEFGREGDAGIVNPEWGTAFFSPEWLLSRLCPQWRVLEFAAGRNLGNQDLYVLERR